MKITINIEDSIMGEILSLTGASTKIEAVNIALKEYVRLKRKQKLIGLSGKIRLTENWREIRETGEK